MIITLRRGDGLQNLAWLGPLVEELQVELGLTGSDVDGWFGPGTERAVNAARRRFGLEETGEADDRLRRALRNGADLPGFRGWLHLIHEAWESHSGPPYWPGGRSGVTLDPGLDLGHADRPLIEFLLPMYRLTDAQAVAVRRAIGVKGDDARDLIQGRSALDTIRVSIAAASGIFPHLARPYWLGISGRFPSLRDPLRSPPAAQTALLSLAINRGDQNGHLAKLAGPIAAGQWFEVAECIARMQQDHKLQGIRRRRREEAALIRRGLEAR